MPGAEYAIEPSLTRLCRKVIVSTPAALLKLGSPLSVRNVPPFVPNQAWKSQASHPAPPLFIKKPFMPAFCEINLHASAN